MGTVSTTSRAPRRPTGALLVALSLATLVLALSGCLDRSDSMAPIVSITDPKSGTTRTTDNLNIVGYAMDDSGVQAIKINGTDVLGDSAYAGERGKKLIRFRFTVSGLADGEVTSHIDVTDVAGRTSSLNYQLTIDNTPPTVELSNVGAAGAGQLHVEGRARDNTRVARITIDGQPLAFTPGPDVPFSVDVATAPDGTIVVEDSAGNQVSRPLQ